MAEGFTPQEEARFKELMKRADTGAGSGGDSGGEPSTGSYGAGFGDFARGVAQSGLNVVEGPAQWAEQGLRKVTGNENLKLPGHDWAAGFRRRAESTAPGVAGEVAGTIGSLFIPFGAIGEASGLGRLASAAGRLGGRAASAVRPAEELPNILSATATAPRGGQAASAVTRAMDAYREASAPTQAAIKGAVGGTLLQPKESEHFGRQAIEDALAGGLVGRFGNIGKRVAPGGTALRDLYREGEIGAVYSPNRPPHWRPPETRGPTERTSGSRERGAEQAAKDYRRWASREGRAAFKPDYQREALLGGENRAARARREYERAIRNYQLRRDLPRHLGHFAWHIPFLFSPHGASVAMKYFGAATLSWLARQYAERARRMGGPGLRSAIEQSDYATRARPYRERLERAFPYMVGRVGSNIDQQTGGVGQYFQDTGNEDAESE